jgi:two-component system chemotaxis response regulator CheB
MPAHFLESFANRLNTHSAPHVRLARNGDVLKQGEVLIAAGGDHHVRVRGAKAPIISTLSDDGSTLYVPSVEVLFRSAVALGDMAVGVMLTGMGSDGAQELLAMRRAGAHTIAQSPETVVVDGMPRAARECGAVMDVCDLGKIAERILRVTSRGSQN